MERSYKLVTWEETGIIIFKTNASYFMLTHLITKYSQT